MSALKNKLKFGRKHDNEGKYLEQNISDYRRVKAFLVIKYHLIQHFVPIDR